MNHRLVQYSPEMEGFEAVQAGPLLARRSTSDAGAFNQAQLLELANEVLEARSEEARTRSFGRLIDRASRALAIPVRPALARALQRALRRIALHALPFTGGPLLTQTNAIVITTGKRDAARPSGQTISDAARLFGLELEGLSAEDQEFELAKSFVQLAGDVVRRAVALPQASPQTKVLRAVAQATRYQAPGLFLDLALNSTRDRLSGRDFTAAHDSKEPTMHDTDRNPMEHFNESYGFQGGPFEFDESEWSQESGRIFNEAEEVQLASELLSVNNESELDRFLGDLVSKATKAVGSFVHSPVGQAVGGVLKGAAKKALPLAGAVGGYFGGPLGSRIGTGLAHAAGNALGLEGEMSSEDREFEGARQFVRLAGQTAATAASAAQGADPRAVAQQAAIAAARQHAPGLLNGSGARSSGAQHPRAAAGPNSGRWLRRGDQIVLLGA